MHLRTLQRPEIAYAFNHANNGSVALRVGTYGARILTIKIATLRAMAHSLRRRRQRACQRHHTCLRFLEQSKHNPPSAPLSQSRQPRKNLYQRIKFRTTQTEISSKDTKAFCFVFLKKKTLLF